MPSTSPLPPKAHSCVFPNLISEAPRSHGNVDTDSDFHSITFQLDVGLEAELFCDSTGLPPASVFQLSWALVLSCFVKSDQIIFDFVDLEHDHSTRINANLDRGLSAAEAVQAFQLIGDPAVSKDEEDLVSSKAKVNTLLRVSRDAEDTAARQSSISNIRPHNGAHVRMSCLHMFQYLINFMDAVRYQDRCGPFWRRCYDLISM